VIQRIWHRQRVWLSALVVLAATSPLLAQSADNEKLLLENFIHYVIIGKHDLAASNGQVLLDGAMSDKELAEVLGDIRNPDRFDRAVKLALKQNASESLRDVAAELGQRMELGYRARAREPERIAESIQMLLGGQRSVALGRERLVEANEYAVPQMLEAMSRRGDAVLKSELVLTFRVMGSRCVAPVAAAFSQLEPDLQERLAGVLGEIGVPTALPTLYETYRNSDNEQVRQACRIAIAAIGGGVDNDITLSALYGRLADRYYTGDDSLVAFPGEAMQLVWDFKPDQGLFAVAVRTEIFGPVMAMHHYANALGHDASDAVALSGWIRANFVREINLPGDYEDPTYGEDMREPMYYAVAAGPAIVHPILARGIEDRNTPLVRRAIAALSRTAGGSSLWSGIEGQPLVDALDYPDRRVRAEASLALGGAMPLESFVGSERVVPELASAIRAADANFAVVLATDDEVRLELAAVAREMGFTLLTPGANLGEIEDQLAITPGIDLFMIAVPLPGLDPLMADIRSNRRLVATPVMIYTDQSGIGIAQRRHGRDVANHVMVLGSDESEQVDAINQLLELASGGLLTEEEAEKYALAALATLRDLAISRSPVYNVADAARQLIEALGDTEADVRLSIADVLSRISSSDAQIALMDAAMNSYDDEQIALLEAVGESAKRYGNMLRANQVEELLLEVETAKGELATTAAATAGALNLPSGYVVPLIVGQ
jgi:HEAT repeat protein